jgi:pyruvate/2-oxoglutarate dehydrogenase complex dihydrolipoamide acyltransferase (E2) component
MTIPSVAKTLLFLTASASAFGVLIHFESMPARAAASPAATPAPAPLVEAPAPPAAASPAPTAPAPSRAVAAPDLVGKRLSIARRTARKLGLAVVAHDDDGLRIDGDQSPYYRVRRQSTPAGTSIESGATVEVRVRGIEPPSGY